MYLNQFQKKIIPCKLSNFWKKPDLEILMDFFFFSVPISINPVIDTDFPSEKLLVGVGILIIVVGSWGAARAAICSTPEAP